MQLTNRLELTPFLKVFTPFCLGIILTPSVGIPLWCVAVIASIVYIAAWLLRGRPMGSIYTYMALFLTAIAIRMYCEPQHNIPQGAKLHIIAEIKTIPHTDGRWQKSTAQIGFFRRDTSKQWHETSETIELYTDTATRIEAGDRLSFRGYLNPLDTTGSSYGRLMWSRGIVSRSFVMPYSVITHVSSEASGLKHYIIKLQSAMAERLSRLRLDEQEHYMLMALVAGDKRGIDKTTINNYSKTGVSHIMSVSGLHMGFVLIVINLLLFWIVAFPYGHVIKNCIVIIALWTYTLAVGASPSVIRAAFMLSMLQMAYATSTDATGYNVLFIAATVMLAVNPLFLYDISFQLSFLAVLSIMFFAGRLYKRKARTIKILDLLLGSISVTIAAQIATLPLVVYNFNQLPLLSIIVNPLIMITSFIIIFLGVIWVVFPFGFMIPVVNKIISWSITAQNGIIDSIADLPIASVDNLNINGIVTLIMYCLLLIIVLLMKLREKDNFNTFVK